MATSELGKIYRDMEIILQQGDPGDAMYVVQEGQVEIVQETERGEVLLAVRGKGEFFGEMAAFGLEARTATVRAIGEARVLTIDKRNLMRRVYEDPSLAFHLLKTMSARIKELSQEVSRLRIEADERSDR